MKSFNVLWNVMMPYRFKIFMAFTRDLLLLGLLIWVVVYVWKPTSPDTSQEESDTIQIQRLDFGTATVQEIVSVYDGDTFTANIADWPPIVGSEIGIRVAGVDTPEINEEKPELQTLAEAAHKFTATKLSKAKTIKLTNLRRDKYFRILANVLVDGKDLGEMLIDADLGKPYEGGTKPMWTISDYKKYNN